MNSSRMELRLHASGNTAWGYFNTQKREVNIMSSERISYKVIANVGTLAKYQTGWNKEVNIVSWNEGPVKLDIRDWSPEHDKMSRGITLNADEVQRLIDSVQSRDAIAMLRDMARPPRTNGYER